MNTPEDMTLERHPAISNSAYRTRLRFLCALVVVSAAVSLALLALRHVSSRSSGVSNGDPDPVIAASAKADARNMEARDRFLEAVHAAYDARAGDLGNATDGAAWELAHFGSCVDLIGKLVRDKFQGTDLFNERVNGVLSRCTGKLMDELSAEIKLHAEHYEESLRESSALLSCELAAVSEPAESGMNLDPDVASPGSIAKNACAGLMISAAIASSDVYFIGRTKIVSKLCEKIAEVARRIFRRPLAIATASLGAAAVDGPMPVGDVFALVGGAMSAWEIYSSRADFEHELKNCLRDSMGEGWAGVGGHLEQYANNLLESHRKLQAEIADKAGENQ